MDAIVVYLSLVWIFLCCLVQINCDVIHYSAANTTLFHDKKSGLRFAYFVQLHTLYLNVTPIKVRQFTKQDDCLLSCVAELKCVSLNFAKSPSSSGQHRCELLAVDIFSIPSNLTINTSYHHFTIKTKCFSTPCKNNGSCIPVYANDTYTCKCKGLTYGRHCELVPHSCRHLQMIAKEKGKEPTDGIYRIYPNGLSKPPVMAYCDMSRDGGGWTLLVTSSTNTWTKDNVLLRNAESPSVTNDYSILKYADDIKNNLNVKGDKFEYRLEANQRGHWGGIWEADRSYTFTATTNQQTNVTLVKKFDNWNYDNKGIEKRMPWIFEVKLTTSKSGSAAYWGSITAAIPRFDPAPWINKILESPGIVWYWMREGPWQQ